MQPDIWDKLIYELDLTLWLRKHGKGMRSATVYKTRLEGFPDGDRFLFPWLTKPQTDPNGTLPPVG